MISARIQEVSGAIHGIIGRSGVLNPVSGALRGVEEVSGEFKRIPVNFWRFHDF